LRKRWAQFARGHTRVHVGDLEVGTCIHRGYNTGQWTTNDRLRFAAQSFCKELSGGVLGPKSFVEWTHNPDFTGSDGASIEIITSVEVMDGCEWESNYDECLRYMKVGIDSCDCRGKNNKHGGMVWNNCLKFRIDPGWIL
jgi:hypothetical protein